MFREEFEPFFTESEKFAHRDKSVIIAAFRNSTDYKGLHAWIIKSHPSQA